MTAAAFLFLYEVIQMEYNFIDSEENVWEWDNEQERYFMI